MNLDMSDGFAPPAAATEGGEDPNKKLFMPFGQHADTAMQQGWYPSTSPDSNGTVVFKNQYAAPFKGVEIPGQKDRGDIALIGRPNQKFDVVIMQKDGNVAHTIFQGISPDQVQQYITKAGGNVDMRNQRAIAGTTQNNIVGGF